MIIVIPPQYSLWNIPFSHYTSHYFSFQICNLPNKIFQNRLNYSLTKVFGQECLRHESDCGYRTSKGGPKDQMSEKKKTCSWKLNKYMFVTVFVSHDHINPLLKYFIDFNVKNSRINYTRFSIGQCHFTLLVSEFLYLTCFHLELFMDYPDYGFLSVVTSLMHITWLLY